MTSYEAYLDQCVARIDAVGLNCPLPLLKTKKALASAKPGDCVYLCATDPNSIRDLTGYAAQAGHVLLVAEESAGLYHFVVEKNRGENSYAFGKVTPV